MSNRSNIYSQLAGAHAEGKKGFAVLIDPDKVNDRDYCIETIKKSVDNQVSYFFVGGSLLTTNNLGAIIKLIKANSNVPVVLFPGNYMQINAEADALLFLSLISGRNAEFLIGQHVVSAPIIKRSCLELLPTGYMLIDSGNKTSVEYMSNTAPIPANKPTIASSTAMAGEMLGLKLIYLEAGSGALHPVPPKIISAVRKAVELPIVVGGGINTQEKARMAFKAGADLLVVGNVLEQSNDFLAALGQGVKAYNTASLNIH